jgi:hypothetical protein
MEDLDFLQGSNGSIQCGMAGRRGVLFDRYSSKPEERGQVRNRIGHGNHPKKSPQHAKSQTQQLRRKSNHMVVWSKDAPRWFTVLRIQVLRRIGFRGRRRNVAMAVTGSSQCMMPLWGGSRKHDEMNE